ncbi:hypothetical protein TOPH_03870, partial [Tolypocladium ophioglossoides CBS 100239]
MSLASHWPRCVVATSSHQRPTSKSPIATEPLEFPQLHNGGFNQPQHTIALERARAADQSLIRFRVAPDYARAMQFIDRVFDLHCLLLSLIPKHGKQWLDKNRDTRVVDFGGVYIEVWVPKELIGIVEGDLVALKKKMAFIR